MTSAERITKERQRLYDLLLTLTPDDWARTSVLRGWTIADIVSHIALEPQYDPLHGAFGIIRYGGINRYMYHAAKQFSSTHAPKQLLTELLRIRTATTTPPGISLDEALIDLFIHRQDILASLSCPIDLTTEDAEWILQHIQSASLTSKIVLHQVFRNLSKFTIHTDRSSYGHGNIPLPLSAPEAVLFLLGREYS